MTINSPEIRGNGKALTDEYPTPSYGVLPILEFLHKDAIVWCPFDKECSEFVRQIQKRGNKVVYSHIEDGKNFFDYESERWDMIVSNPRDPEKVKELIY